MSAVPHSSFLHRALHALAMGAVVVHLVGGCCWHHAHAACEDRSPARAIADERGECVHHAGCGEGHREPAEHHHPCETGRCVFVAPSTGSPGDVGGEALPAVLPAATVVPPAACESPFPTLPGSLHGGGPRLHLLKQVLLI